MHKIIAREEQHTDNRKEIQMNCEQNEDTLFEIKWKLNREIRRK
jgi:hypothetical protein